MRLLPVIGLLVVAGAARPAEAMKCSTSIGEDLSLRLVGVYDGGRKVAAPPELRRIDALSNWELMVVLGKREEDGRAYRMDRPLRAGWGVITHLRASQARRWVRTACGYSIPFMPVLPGRYVFEPDWDGDPVAAEVAASVVIVAPGRDRVELRIRVGGRDVRAVYRVTCATFDTSGDGPKSCAASQSLAYAEELATAMRRPPLDADADYWEVFGWMIGEDDEDEDEDEDGAQAPVLAVESQLAGGLATGPREPAVIAAPALALPTAAADPPASAARCGVAEPVAMRWLMLVWLVAWRRAPRRGAL